MKNITSLIQLKRVQLVATNISQPTDRQYHCSKCKFGGIRDEVGAINLLNKYLNKGEILPNFLIPKGKVKYLRPVKLKRFARR